MKKTGKIINFAAIGVVAAIVVTLNVLCLSTFRDQIQTFIVGGGTANQETITQSKEEGEALAEDIVDEGSVLVKNENNTLPLSKQTNNKINVFGWGSSYWITGGSGSGRVVNTAGNLKAETDLLKALENENIEYNTDLTDFYVNYEANRPHYSTSEGTLNAYEYEYYRIIEPSMDEYGDNLLADAEEFSDTAIVVIGRAAGESSDAPKVQYKGNSTDSRVDDSTRHYLEISTEEEDLLEYVGSTFENVVVVINSTNTMELGFLDTIEGIDSCLIVGATGINAASGVVNVLYGDANPSGKLTDTYAYDMSTAASYINAGIEGENFYTNGNGLYPADGTTQGNLGHDGVRYPGVAYVDYQESIYVGYKWYETANTEGFWDDVDNEYGVGYEGVVQYPFGYGLSYTENFLWNITDISLPSGSNLTRDSEIEIEVTVTNDGTVAGADVVELYYTAPYYDGEIEKSSVNLIDFAKTPVLQPDQSVVLTLSVSAYDMTSYDCYDLNENDATTYELDQGEYQLSLRTDAHTIKEELEVNGLSAEEEPVLTYNLAQTEIFDTDPYTENKVTNHFTGENATDGCSIDGNSDTTNVEYLSRADFERTFPDELNSARALDDSQREYNLYTSNHANDFINPDDEPVTFNSDETEHMLYDPAKDYEITELGLELGKNYDDPRWDEVLDQMSQDEMRNLVLHGYVGTRAVDSVGKPQFTDVDGPAQFGSFNLPRRGVGYPNATVLAQTWSKSLAYNYGIAMGEIARNLGYDGWYGPGMNLHRSPFGGRNYEYYSEDPILSGIIGANSVRGAKNRGVYSYLKHLAVYDQESYRDGLYTWLTEQAFRENFLKPFQMTVQEGGASGIMTSYNRVGGVWAGGSYALLTEVVKEEWGFKGTILTDYADHHSFMNMDHALRAGGDLWMDGYQNNGQFRFETQSNTFWQNMRRASKNILYTGVNAIYTAANPVGDNEESFIIGGRYVPNTSWMIAFYVLDPVIFIGLGVWGVFVFLSKDKTKEPKKEEEVSSN